MREGELDWETSQARNEFIEQINSKKFQEKNSFRLVIEAANNYHTGFGATTDNILNDEQPPVLDWDVSI